MPPRIPFRRRLSLAAAGLLATLLPMGAAAGQTVTVKEVTPDRIRLVAGDGGARVQLLGAGLGTVIEAWVELRGRPVPEVASRVQRVSDEELRLELVAGGSAPGFAGELVVVSRDGTRTRVSGLTMEVVAAEPPVREVIADPGVLEGDSRADLVVVLARRAATDVTVRLSSTHSAVALPSRTVVPAGADRTTVSVRVRPVARRATARISAGTSSGTAEVSVDLTPPPTFAPTRRATPPLAFSGLTFEPRTATTPSLFFVGPTFEPRRATAPSLVFTGPRFQPRRAATPALVFTGNRPPTQENDT